MIKAVETAIRPTAPERLSAFNRLRARIYQDDGILNQDALKDAVYPHR